VSQSSPFRWALLCSLFLCAARPARAQQPAEKAPETPAQIELLETHIRYEDNGDSRKEVHTRVRVNTELGVRQFSRLTFDYNRSFQQVEIPSVHITHASGGTADILPSAISDQANPAVVDVPAYQDVRVKSVRILGLAPSDMLEYRVVTTTTHHPLAPDFWLEHNFDRSGVVTQEIFELDLPASRFQEEETAKPSSSPDDPAAVLPSHATAVSNPTRPGLGTIYASARAPKSSREEVGIGEKARLLYRWNRTAPQQPSPSDSSPNAAATDSDVVVTTYSSWDALAQAIAHQLYPSWFWSSMSRESPEIMEKRKQLLAAPGVRAEESVYNFISQKVRTIDLPLGSTGFHGRGPAEILSSGYGTSEDKAVLFTALVGTSKVQLDMVPNPVTPRMRQLPRPSMFNQLLLQVGTGPQSIYLDPSLEVAPFGVIRADLRGKDVLMLYHPAFYSTVNGQAPELAHSAWHKLSTDLPFKSSQKVTVDASISAEGTLNAKVRYAMRGDNELLLRVAFHQSPREKWKDVAQLLALSDGFRGKIISASASDPYATKQPFTVEYEISQPKFIDWSKKPVRIFALLPFLGLPDLPAKSEAGSTSTPIDLGTPLSVDTKLTLHLPAGASAQGPTGTSVERDYATFVSHYAAEGNVVFASRHINFILREVPAARAADYNAFLHAVQTDQSQLFTLDRAAAVPAAMLPGNQAAAVPDAKP
jgi:hypothetical protein